MAGSDAMARWWRVTVEYCGHLVEDRRFEPGERVTVGEGGAAIVLPGVSASALVEGDAVREAPGLELLRVDDDGTHELAVTAAPDVVVRARLESCERPRLPSSARMPWRELAYGIAAAGCIAGVLLVHALASASPPGGGASAMTDRMERAIFVELDTPTPTVAMFAPPIEIDDEPETVALTNVAIEDAAPEAKPEPKPESKPKSKPKTKRAKPRPHARPSAGESSHAAAGAEERGGGPGDAVASAHRCDDPRSEPKDHVDVVFVIDVSTTMAFALDRLAEEITALDAAVREHDEDRRYGLVLFVDDVLMVDGNPYTDIETLRADFREWSRFTGTNRQIHSEAQNLDWPENGLDALVTAAESFDWRDADDTLRLVVYASDDDFGERGAVQSGQHVRNSYAHAVEVLQAQSIRVASFTAPIGGQCECDDVRAGFMKSYRGREPIPVATGGASFDIDDVAAGRLHFDRALTGLVDNLVCDG